jgi:hypothetical protein
MANVDFPSGFEPVRYEGTDELACETATLSATNAAVYMYDILEMHTDGYARVCGSADPVKVLGIAAEYVAANTGGTVKYYPAKGLLMRAQVDDDAIDGQEDMDLTYKPLLTTGDTTTKRSKQEIDGSESHATDYLVLIRRVAESRTSAANALGTNVTVECVFNPTLIK